MVRHFLQKNNHFNIFNLLNTAGNYSINYKRMLYICLKAYFIYNWFIRQTTWLPAVIIVRYKSVQRVPYQTDIDRLLFSKPVLPDKNDFLHINSATKVLFSY